MKRNKARNLTSFILFFFIPVFSYSWSITSEVKVQTNPDFIVTYDLINPDTNKIFANISKGYESQIIIQVRLYKKRDLPYSLIGDEVIENIEIIKTAEIDIFSETYKVTNQQDIHYFEERSNFLTQFLHHKIEIPQTNINIDELNSYYVKIRATIINKNYISPFNIFYLLNFKNRITTGWVDYQLLQD